MDGRGMEGEKEKLHCERKGGVDAKGVAKEGREIWTRAMIKREREGGKGKTKGGKGREMIR